MQPYLQLQWTDVFTGLKVILQLLLPRGSLMDVPDRTVGKSTMRFFGTIRKNAVFFLAPGGYTHIYRPGNAMISSALLYHSNQYK